MAPHVRSWGEGAQGAAPATSGIAAGGMAAQDRSMKTDEIAAELVKQGRLADAQMRLAGLAATNNASVDWNDLGAVQFAMHAFAEAETSFRRALALDAANSQAGANLGALLVQTGRGAEAIPVLERALPHLDDEERTIAAGMLQQCRVSLSSVAGPAQEWDAAVPEPEVSALRREVQETLQKQSEVVGHLAQRLMALEQEVGRLRSRGAAALPSQSSTERRASPDLFARIDQFLECAITNPDTRQDAWNYLQQRIWSYLHRLPDDFGPDSAWLQVGRQWMQGFVRCFVAGNSPDADWRIARASAALQPLAAEMGLNLSGPAAIPGDDSPRAAAAIPGLDDERQAGLLNEFRFAYRDELQAHPPGMEEAERCFLDNGVYEGADADSLYCMVRHLKPRHILHFGSADSVMVAARAAAKNKELDSRCECRLIAIDPFPNALLQTESGGAWESIRSRLRDVTPAHLMMDDSSLLFVDCSIALRGGEDAAYLFDGLLPALPAGAWVHLHDVWCGDGGLRLPLAGGDQGKKLHSFLNSNESFDVVLALHALHASGSPLTEVFPHGPARGALPPTAFWMRKRP